MTGRAENQMDGVRILILRRGHQCVNRISWRIENLLLCR